MVPYSECRERILRLAVDAEMLGKRCEMISFKEAGPIPTCVPAWNCVSKSDASNPKLVKSKVGTYFLLSLTGFVFVNK